MRKKIVAAIALWLALLSQPAFADAKFEAFIQSLWPVVQKSGISRDLFDRAFAGITDPDPAVVKLANTQPVDEGRHVPLKGFGRSSNPNQVPAV